MKKEALLKLRKPLHIVLSISLFVAGICLMAACVGIYRSGDKPFTPESVAAAFGPISLPVFLCLGLILVTALYELIVPANAEKKAPGRQTRMVLNRMQERIDLDKCDEELRKAVLAHRSSRKLFRMIGWTILVISSVLFLTYGTNPHNFHSTNITESMVRAMYWLLPCCLIPFLYGMFSSQKNLISMKSELELLKTAPKESKIAPHKKPARNMVVYVRAGIALFALAILIFGFLAGGTADVLTKAVNICTECVGLG